ncbi:hypothetical protein [Sphingomonas sp. 35-24ZXX]|nr:hypothetical protein [Sphingomonas sp. 35-24ZXX]
MDRIHGPAWPFGHWLRILKGDRKAIFTAASAANKAAEYMLSLGG